MNHFGALDAQVRKDLRRWLRAFHDEIGLTTLFVTHDQEEALELADQVVVMRRSKVEQVGSPQEIYDHPSTPFVYEFLGNVNKIVDQHGRERYVRPHDIEIKFAAEYDQNLDELAAVQHLFSAGPVASVSLRLKSGALAEAEISRKQLEYLALGVGDRVAFRLPDPNNRQFTNE